MLEEEHAKLQHAANDKNTSGNEFDDVFKECLDDSYSSDENKNGFVDSEPPSFNTNEDDKDDEDNSNTSPPQEPQIQKGRAFTVDIVADDGNEKQSWEQLNIWDADLFEHHFDDNDNDNNNDSNSDNDNDNDNEEEEEKEEE